MLLSSRCEVTLRVVEERAPGVVHVTVAGLPGSEYVAGGSADSKTA